MYEQKIKGQALFHIFSDMLVEIYQKLDADKAGWETAANYLEDTPMRICALQALKRIDELEEMPESDYLYMVEQFNGLSDANDHPQGAEIRRAAVCRSGKEPLVEEGGSARVGRQCKELRP